MMTVIAHVFPEILAPKIMVREMSKIKCFRGTLVREHGKWVNKLLQSEWQRIYKIY